MMLVLTIQEVDVDLIHQEEKVEEVAIIVMIIADESEDQAIVRAEEESILINCSIVWENKKEDHPKKTINSLNTFNFHFEVD